MPAPHAKKETPPKKDTATDRIAILEHQIHEQQKLADERLTQLKYLQADFDNYKKYADKEKHHIIQLANENLINHLLAILDDFDNALTHSDEHTREGLAKLHQKLTTILTTYGLQPIESTGKPFNPHYHEAIKQQESDHQEGTIIEEVQKGYQLHNKVIRPSKVIIAKNTQPHEQK